MWKVKLTQAYYDMEGFWVGQAGIPVDLQSKFGDTDAVYTEIQEFLKEQGDEKPITLEKAELDALWEEARKDPRVQYELKVRSDDYKEKSPDGVFEGTVQIELWATFNQEIADENRKAAQDPPEPEPEQLSLF